MLEFHEDLNNGSISRSARVTSVEQALRHGEIEFGPLMVAEQQHECIHDPTHPDDYANFQQG